MPLDVIADGYVCTDCVCMIANGEVPFYTSEERQTQVAVATIGWSLAEDDAHPTNEFSTSPCACCKSRLYGERMWAVKLGERG